MKVKGWTGMATAFDYEAIDETGKSLTGALEAQTTRDAIHALNARGLTPVRVSAAKPSNPPLRSFSLRRSPSDQDYILTLHQLTLLLNAGVPLISGVETLKSQSIHPELARAFANISKSLRSGTAFSEALKTALPSLPAYVFQLCAAGETIGDLGPALKDAGDQLEYEYRVKQDFRNALTYPSILVGAGVTAVLFIFIVVVPRFSAMLTTGSGDIPLLSRIVLSTGMALSENKALILFSFAAAMLIGTWIFQQRRVRNELRQRLFALPLLGSWIKEAELARWASMLSTMLKHGVDLIKALELARQTMTIRFLYARMELIIKSVRGGKALSAAMAEQNTFSDTALSLVQVGENSGELASMLDSLAHFYNDSGRQRMKKFLMLLEPAAIIIIGVVIGGIVTAIMLAITSINQVSL